jgi:hypothetical protein
VLGLLVLSAVGLARAGDESFCEAGEVADYPPDGDADVPLRPVFVLRENLDGSSRSFPLELQAPDGGKLRLNEVPLANFCGKLMTPAAPLAPETSYRLRLRGDEVVTFTTRAGDAGPAPTLKVGADRDPSTLVEVDFESNVRLVLMTAEMPFVGGTRTLAFSPVESPMRFDAAETRPGAPIVLKAWDRVGQSVEVMVNPDSPAERDAGCSAVPAPRRAHSEPLLLGLFTLLVLWVRRPRGE